MPRYFNTAGPCEPHLHYMVPAVERLPDAPGLVEQGHYWVLHAPRQSGKTTTLRALARRLTAEGKFAALHFSCEVGQASGEDFESAQHAVLSNIRQNAQEELPIELRPPSPWPPRSEPATLLSNALIAWSKHCPRPLVLFFDEIDALRGQSLISVLRQLRAGFPMRPNAFPHAVVLCGLRDVRDYKAASGGDPSRLGTSSPFNIKVKSSRLTDFSSSDVHSLYAQHTGETGQAFETEALNRIMDLCGGQPWLVNAIAREVINEMGVTSTVTVDHVEQAKERIILERATHLDSLVARLQEDRVKRIIEPMMAGNMAEIGNTYDDDFSYVRDLGIIAPTDPPRPANPIYREVMMRTLTVGPQRAILVEPRSFVLPDGRLDFPKMLQEFAEFWREHGEVLEPRVEYREIAPQLILMAFLQRVVNGGGIVDREYGVGRGRIDLFIRWPYTNKDGKRVLQKEAIELKSWPLKKGDPLAKGLVQLEAYLDGLGLTKGYLVIFDRRPNSIPLEDRVSFEEARTTKGYEVLVLRG